MVASRDFFFSPNFMRSKNWQIFFPHNKVNLAEITTPKKEKKKTKQKSRILLKRFHPRIKHWNL
jgi:hypothetical protein